MLEDRVEGPQDTHSIDAEVKVIDLGWMGCLEKTWWREEKEYSMDD